MRLLPLRFRWLLIAAGVSARQAGLPQPPPTPRNQFGTRAAAAAQASGFGASLGGIHGCNVFHMYLDIQDNTSVIYDLGAEHAITSAAFPVAFDRRRRVGSAGWTPATTPNAAQSI
jgi:hypothetical protein